MTRVIQLPRDPRRILIIKPSSLGDVVHALPVLVRLRQRFPDAHIAWLVAPYCAGLIQGLPQLNEVILFDRRRFARAWRDPRVMRDLLAFVRSLRNEHFDLVLDLQGLLRSGILSSQTRAPLRIGFASARELAPLFYTHRIPAHPDQHAIDRYLLLADALGCEMTPVQFPFPVTEKDHAYIAQLIPSNQEFAVLLPATNWPTKRWPAAHFESLIKPLHNRFGLTSILAGGPDAADLAPQIPSALNLAGQTTIPQLIALLQRAALVIANDSGPMHIAAALNRPLITLFGPTNPIRTGPYRRDDCVLRLDIPCSPCYSRKCSHQSCLQWLTIDPVLAATEAQLERRIADQFVV